MQSQLALFVSLEPGSAIDPEWLPLLDPPGHLRGSEQLVAWDLLSFQVTSSPVWLQTCAPPPLPPECKACMWTRVSFQMESVVWVMAALPSGRVLNGDVTHGRVAWSSVPQPQPRSSRRSRCVSDALHSVSLAPGASGQWAAITFLVQY